MSIRIPNVVGALGAQSFGARSFDAQNLDTQSCGSQCGDAQRLSDENRSAQPLLRWNAIGGACPSSAGREASLARDADDPLHSDGFLQNEGLALRGNERWFLVYTLPKKELQALMRLRVQGFRLYLPQYLRTVRHARQLRTYRAPLFPRYMFVIL
ncbi:MAG TPA: transcription termination/antitermination NusG family protein, partial [Rhabdochlamydiaceae bacterium]